MQIELEQLLTNKPEHFEGTVVVREWGNREWNHCHTYSMLQLLSQYQVKKIKFLGGEYKRGFFKTLEQIYYPKIRFLHYLRTIEVESDSYPPAAEVGSIMRRSRVVKVTWKLSYSMTEEHHVKECRRILKALEQFKLFESVSHLREFKFVIPKSDTCKVFVPFKPEILDYSILEAHLQRNRNAFAKCQNVIITLLGLKKKKEIMIDRDVLKIVVNMVWVTRGTKSWSPEEIK